jgi:large subunit ribosomal protein L4
MKITLYTQAGKKKGDATVSDVVFGAKWNEKLVSQVVRAMEANKRTPVAHAKDRSEVRGGGRKPWKQKGTGQARHGSIRSPLWVGGGKAHGPRNERDYSQKINSKMRANALFSALSSKVSDGSVVFLDALTFDAPKTKEAVTVLESLGGAVNAKDMATRKKNAVLIATTGDAAKTRKSFGNIPSVEVMSASDLNPVAVLKYKYLVMVNPEEASATLEKRVVRNKLK